MTTKRIKNEKGGYFAVKKEEPLEEDVVNYGDFKITVKAHFQIAHPKADDPLSFKFKAKAGGVQKIIVLSSKFKCMQDIYAIIKQLSDRDAKCGSFDVHSPKPIRLLTYSSFDSKFTMSDDDLLDFPLDFLHVQYNSAAPSLTTQRFGAKFHSLSTTVDDVAALFKTALQTTSRNIYKTLSTMAAGTFFGKIPAFVLVLTADEKPILVVADTKFVVVKQYIEIIAEQCNMEGVVDLGAMQKLIESRLNSPAAVTKESWQAFRDSSHDQKRANALVLHQDDFINENTSSSSTTVVVTPAVKTINPVWAFLGDVECPVAKQAENGKVVIVDVKDFTSLNIREQVTLVLQISYKETRAIGDLFHVTRFSTEEGTLATGKFLNGRFGGEGEMVKVSHLNFVLQDEESPPMI